MRSILVLVAVLLLLVGCGGPAPIPTPTASPAPTASEGATVGAVPPIQASPSASSIVAVPAPPSTVIPAPSVVPTPEPERLLVTGNGSPTVNMRSEPGISSSIVKSVRDGTEVIVVGTDGEAEGRIWRNVRDGDTTGWIATTALRSLPTPTVTPSITPTPSTTPTLASTATSTVTVTGAPSVTAAPGEPRAASEAERVEVVGTEGQGANLRADPGTSGRVLQTVPDGTQLTVAGPDRDVGGLTWRNVRGESGTTGWIVSDALRSLATPSVTPTATSASTSTPPPAPTMTPTPASTGSAATGTPTVPSTPSPTPSDVPAGTGTPPATGTPTPPPAAPETPSAPGASSATPAPAPATEEPTPEPATVEVYGTGNTGANLRVAPRRTGSVLRSVPDGARLTIIGDDEDADGTTWRHVRTDDGLSGWLALEVVQPVVTPTATPRPGAPGIGVPIAETPKPEAQLSEAELAARPCRPGQVKGDASTGIYYAADHPEYPGLLQRVRCFDDVSRARASGFRPPDPPAPSPTP